MDVFATKKSGYDGKGGSAMPTVLDEVRTPVQPVEPPLPCGDGPDVCVSTEQRPRLGASRDLGRYRILEKIGEGGMGRIYAAWDKQLGRKVALKVSGGRVRQAVCRSRLEREARALAALSHPNVVAVYDYCEVGGDAFAVMEYLDGSTLRELIGKAPLPKRVCLDVGAQIADGLAAIHRAALVHRDLKPDNVQVLSSGRVKILDLGLSIRLGSLRPKGGVWSERAGDDGPGLSGTPPYMAPEQLQGRGADYRSDVYAFGVLLLEMLTGRPPASTAVAEGWGGSNVAEIARRCVHVRPEDRYGSAVELASAFSALQGAVEGNDSYASPRRVVA